MPYEIAGIECDVGGLKPQPATRGHRVPCVEREIDDHLLQLAGIGPDPADGGIELGHQLDVGAEQAAQHPAYVRDYRVEVEHPGLEHLLPGKGQQLPGDSRCASRRLHHLIDVGPEWVILGQALEHEAAEADHRGHHIVDLVGHAAGQAAHRFQPLRLPQMLRRPALVFHVDAGSHPLNDLAAGSQHRHSTGSHPAVLAVVPEQPVFGVERLFPRDRPTPPIDGLVTILRMDRHDPSPPLIGGTILARVRFPRW
jgi:hypothetical protein